MDRGERPHLAGGDRSRLAEACGHRPPRERTLAIAARSPFRTSSLGLPSAVARGTSTSAIRLSRAPRLEGSSRREGCSKVPRSPASRAPRKTYKRRRSALSAVFLDGLAGGHRAGYGIAPQRLYEVRWRGHLAPRDELLESVVGQGSEDRDGHSIMGHLERLALAYAPNGCRERVSKLSNTDASAHVSHVATRPRVPRTRPAPPSADSAPTETDRRGRGASSPLADVTAELRPYSEGDSASKGWPVCSQMIKRSLSKNQSSTSSSTAESAMAAMRRRRQAGSGRFRGAAAAFASEASAREDRPGARRARSRLDRLDRLDEDPLRCSDGRRRVAVQDRAQGLREQVPEHLLRGGASRAL